MGNSTPDHESAHEHELVTDDDLLAEEPASSPAEADAAVEPRGLRLEDLTPRRALVRVGEVLAGKYRIERIHAPGALGVTCDAQHRQLRQRVVVKLCGAFAAPHSQVAVRFLESARVAAQLRNVHLARLLDIGTLDSGVPYSVTEHLSGTDLRGVLRVREWLPVSEAVDYILQVCEALAVAHVAGLVHRNLKPTNVFLARDDDGRPIVKVLDFCLVEGALSDVSLTTSTAESIVSSLAYLAPEQVRDPSSVDVRADIWAVGALLHELLTGVPPYTASSVPGIFAAIAADSPTPVSQLRGELPTELEEVVLRCLEKERDYRWSDVGTLARQLRRFASEAGRDAVDRVIMVLERRTRSPRSARPPALKGVDAPPPVERAVSDPPVELPPSRRLLEVGLAAMAIVGCSVGIGAFIAIHNLQSLLATRVAVTRPVVASLSPALPALPPAPTPNGAAKVAAPAPSAALQLAPAPAPKPGNQTITRAQLEAAPRSLAPTSAPPAVTAEPAASTQALFDNAN